MESQVESAVHSAVDSVVGGLFGSSVGSAVSSAVSSFAGSATQTVTSAFESATDAIMGSDGSEKLLTREKLLIPTLCKLFKNNEKAYELKVINDDLGGVDVTSYNLIISYSEPLILNDIEPYIANIAVLFYCNHGDDAASHPLIHREVMTAPPLKTKSQLMNTRDITEAFTLDLNEDGNGQTLIWNEFTLDLTTVLDKLCWQCESDDYIGCVHTAPNGFGKDVSISRYEMEDMNSIICGRLCGHTWHFAISGTLCLCSDDINEEDPYLDPAHLVPNTYCLQCPTGQAGTFCGDDLNDFWSVSWVPGMLCFCGIYITILNIQHAL